MPNIDLTIDISAIIAFAAIISPIFVAIINNWHNYKVRKLELQYDMSMKELHLLYENKRNAFSNFLLNAGKVCTNEALHNVEQDFYGQAQLVLLYSSKENQELVSGFMDDIIQYLDCGIPHEKYSYFQDQLFKISESLNKELTVLSHGIFINKKRI